MSGLDAARLLQGAPAPVDACGAARPQQLVVAVTLVLQARAVLDGVDEVPEEELAHRPHLEHLAVGDLARVRAVVCADRGRGGGGRRLDDGQSFRTERERESVCVCGVGEAVGNAFLLSFFFYVSAESYFNDKCLSAFFTSSLSLGFRSRDRTGGSQGNFLCAMSV